MKFNFSTLKRLVTSTLFCVLAIALVWQSSLFSSNIAMANSSVNTLVANVGNEVQGKASKDAGATKDFIRDTADKVKETAKENAARVDRATDDNSFIERKAQRDAARIENKANKDADRTQKAVDNTKNIIESTVDNIKDAFSN